MVNITLEKMLNILADCILNNKEQPTFYYGRLSYDDCKLEYIKIKEVDLLDTRFRTIDGDFSEYDWELEKSNIYMEDNN